MPGADGAHLDGAPGRGLPPARGVSPGRRVQPRRCQQHGGPSPRAARGAHAGAASRCLRAPRPRRCPPHLSAARTHCLLCLRSLANPCCPALPLQLDAPEKITIPDTFNPAEWGKRGGGLGGGGGGFKIPDSFNPADLEREKDRTNVAVLERPPEKLDPGKKYRVLLFNDEANTREYVIEVLMKYIPGMSAEMAKEITARAHNTGMAIVGIWMYELAEGYSDILKSNGLRSDIEAD